MMQCRFCRSPLKHVFADLGHAPPSNAYLTPDDLEAPETYYPLKIWTCSECFLTQIDEFKSHAEIFSRDYAYFSSFSSSWLAHARDYVDKVAARFSLDEQSQVTEIAANDGYLLQFVQEKGIPCLGVEPTASTAAAARAKGIDVREDFFGADTARALLAEGYASDLMVANNVLAHVPDICDFVAGFKTLLKPEGVVTFEFPHLLQLVRFSQFDTIYHEHFSYLSLGTVARILEAAGLRVFDTEALSTHGGSLRVYACHAEASHAETGAPAALQREEDAAGMGSICFYKDFQGKVDALRLAFLDFLVTARREGKSVAAYGAAAKGNTLFNFCGVKRGMIDYVCDLSPHKQGLMLPGSHIPVVPPARLAETRPDYIVILPWNLRGEIEAQLSFCRDWGGRFVVAVPEMEVF